MMGGGPCNVVHGLHRHLLVVAGHVSRWVGVVRFHLLDNANVLQMLFTNPHYLTIGPVAELLRLLRRANNALTGMVVAPLSRMGCTLQLGGPGSTAP